MKRKVLLVILCIEAAACVFLCVLKPSFTSGIAAIMAFPFAQLGTALRSLSLSGVAGNAAAIVVYAAISLLPVAAVLILRRKSILRAEDCLLGILSAVLFAVMYFMINPGVMATVVGGAAGQDVGKAILGGMVYSILIGYAVLRILRMFYADGAEKLMRYMSVMLSILNVLFVYFIFGACFGGLLDSISSLKAGNSGNEHLLGASYFFLVLQFIVDALPYVFDVLVVFAALKLLTEMRADRYSAETVGAAGRISHFCAAALVTTVLSQIIFNLLQLLLAKSLLIINSTVQIPVFSIAFVLAALLLTRLVTENKQLKDDNDMFI